MKHSFAAALAAIALAGCADPKERALLSVKDYVQQNLVDFHQAALDLQAVVPEPDADGFNAESDAQAVDAMRAHWKKARAAYEHVEGAIAVLFPELDVSTDERYDGFVTTQADDNLFDGQGVTGVHAIERILWANQIPSQVRDFEASLPNYSPAASPANEEQARAFKEKLVGRLVADAEQMKKDFAPLALDPAAAFRGVIGSMQEQLEKAEKAATGEEESRYSRYTLADMRANIGGGLAIYGAFRPWLLQQQGGETKDREIQAGLGRMQDKYDELEGDALPPVPSGWSSVYPTPEDLNSPFGRLYSLLKTETDPEQETSTVHAMQEAAALLQIPALPE